MGNGVGERSSSKDLSRGREKRKKGNSILGINEEGYWIYEFYNTEDILTDVNGEPVAALAKTERDICTTVEAK
ncbi:hypothetical protein BFINE_07100 [Bacteroides finegoldii DSM 17565]|nr:hypothetical protein BFINE_07100 [Bacteroides finegoldii DSM 17565]